MAGSAMVSPAIHSGRKLSVAQGDFKDALNQFVHPSPMMMH